MRISKEKIELSMERNCLSTEGLAKKAAMPKTSLANVLTKKTCKPLTVGKIAKALGVDVTEIIETEE